MLQNDPVRNLQLDGDIRIAQSTHIERINYSDHYSYASNHRYSDNGSVQPYDFISTVDFMDGNISIPVNIVSNGLNILTDMPSLHIEQTLELNDSLTGISSENRYTIRSSFREALFSATESSTARNRMLWGPARPFQMHLLDRSHQEVLSLRKKMSFGCICCQPRKMEVWAPPGDLLGCITENLAFLKTHFFIENDQGDILFEVESPIKSTLFAPKEANFKIFSPNKEVLKGSITRLWSKDISQYTLNIYFIDRNLSVKTKALFLGTAFLMVILCNNFKYYRN